MTGQTAQPGTETVEAGDPTLAELQEKLAALRAERPGESSSSKADEQYPQTIDETFVCKRDGCSRAFTVPMTYWAPGRRFGRQPDWCPSCVEAHEWREKKRIEQEEAEARQRAEERAKLDVLAKMEQAGGNPYAYGRDTLATFVARAGRELGLSAAREWAEAVLETRDRYEEVKGLYLYGDTGTAKTALAHCALRALLDAGMEPVREVLFDDSLSLIERIQGTYGSDENTWRILQARIDARVWILDDLMAEKPSPDVVRKLTLIFNRREGRPTMVTSNELPSRLTELNSEYFRLQSRFGPARFRIVKTSGEDARFTRRVAAV